MLENLKHLDVQSLLSDLEACGEHSVEGGGCCIMYISRIQGT